MSDRTLAAVHDASDEPLRALRCYERAIEVGDGDLETYLNLAVLYFECCDHGYATHHRIPDEIVKVACERSQATLDAAQKRFGSHNEIEFWRDYIDQIVLGRDLDLSRLQELAQRGPSLVPYLSLFTMPGGQEHRSQAMALMNRVVQGATARDRYIRSILESRLKQP